jgi:parallel beta-helix repeat protein
MQLHTQADGMKPKTLVVLMAIILACNLFTPLDYIKNCKADVLPKFYVDDDYDSSTPGWQVDHFRYIQDAIDASSAGDRIVVYAGSYSETITIPHKLDLFGEDKTLTTVTGADSGDRITISASNVNISHFTIQNCGGLATNAVIFVNSGNTMITDNIIQSGAKHGIFINNCDDNTIYDNTIKSNSGNGIYLNHSDSNAITYNSITSNVYNGLFLYNSYYNTIENNAAIKSNSYNGIFLNETCNYNDITNNNLSSNTKNGIFLNDHCDHNTLSSNDIYSNSDSGIRLENSSSNTISDSVINSNTDYGIMIVGSSNTIQSNTINSNGDHGIFLFADNNNIISGNTIGSNTLDGIQLSNSTDDSIYSNEISSNSRYGINLDYFTTNNLIYNNYFHDNTDNSIDKSLSCNTWNITKTSGTNKVGGSYKCGNYWDDFDETSEGASDSNGDGIANSAYTIYGSNKDYGPLLDVTNPSIGIPKANPSSQTIGSYTYISVTVTDNTEIKEVDLYITNPNNQTTSFSILQNETGNTYYCNKKHTTVGTYTYYVKAKDPRNWATSSNITFYINEGTPPTITDNTPTTGYASKTFTFNATVTDDGDSVSELTVKVQWSHGGKGGNYTMENSGSSYFEKEVTLDSSTASVSYNFYARDQWGNSGTTAQKKVSVIDNEPPTILINTYGPSTEDLPNSYTFGATITDNTAVEEVTIEYWYEGSEHMTVEMDKSGTYYDKVIIIDENPDRVFCIINAIDLNGNQNDTKDPFANAGGSYAGVIGIELTFNATNSFDLDGEITGYAWTFGDGITGTGEATTHKYYTNGDYTITLTVTDDDGNTDIDTTYAVIISSVQQKTTSSTMNEIENEYDITLTELFYSYDSDGDSIVDTFVDPNNVLKAVHAGGINISGSTTFMLSVDDSTIPEFIWDADTDELITITNVEGTTNKPIIDFTNNIAVANVTVDKTDGWIYIEVEDPELEDDYSIIDIVTVWKNNAEINEDKIIRKNKKTYVLDDPKEEYQFNYSIQPPTLGPAEFTPESGGTIDKNNPMITISYDIAVTVQYADFYNSDTLEGVGTEYDTMSLNTTDNKTFYCTPPPDLNSGNYIFDIYVKEQNNPTNERDDSAVYSFVFYEVIEEEMVISFSTILMILGTFGAAGAALFLIIKYKNITFESFIYIKNKKIIPFFKPLVFGPLRIDVNDEKVKKAKFYINGELKETITQAPYIWDWNESSFMKKTIETKIYDQVGQSSSTGKMTYFVFNSPKLFK